MATLVSPGVEVTVIDESQYTPGISGSIPYILLATAQDKISGTGSSTTIAAGTIASAVNVVTPVSSQRELIALFGIPSFQTDTTGSVIQGHELNEYGLQTAYSALGVTNQIYVQRADINLDELVGTSVRPTHNPNDGTLWMNLSNTDYGLFEWTSADQVFNKIYPTVVDDVVNTSAGVPNADVVGPYAVVTISDSNPIYYRDSTGAWTLVGSTAWMASIPVHTGTEAEPVIGTGGNLTLNTEVVTIVDADDLAAVVLAINTAAIAGITASDVDDKLALYVDATATSDGGAADGKLDIDGGTGTIIDDLGIVIGIYNMPATQLSAHTSVPEWKTADTTPRPTGSVWVKTTTPNLGADFVINRYNDDIDEWVRIDSTLYLNDASANKAMDPTGGGANISAGNMYVRYDTLGDTTVTYTPYIRAAKGTTIIVGDQTDFTSNPLTTTDTFTVQVSQRGYSTYTAAETIEMSGTDAASFVADVLNANVPYLSAGVTATGAISMTHELGGVIVLKNVTGIPLTDAGISAGTQYVEAGNDSDLIASNWVKAVYSASYIRPSVDPIDGTYWYFADVDDVDIMCHDGTGWKGYKNVSVDARGFDLTITDPAGPTVAASAPLTQSDGTPIETGDLWIDISTLVDHPKVYRWSALGGGNEDWVLVDSADQTTENGILFSDARWDTDGTTDVITGDYPSIVDMLASDYLDLDAPEAALYPRGTLLWNTRRSSFNVKQYVEDYFVASTFDGPFPTETATWKTASGLKSDGSPYMGDEAVRAIVVAAMKSGLDSSLTAREEQNMFNLIVTPGYPELISNMITLNIDRKETAFVIGDSPMTLAATSLELQNWANNTFLADDNGTKGLVSNDEYLGVYYPSGLTNDLSGNSIVMPSSYMSLRTMIRSDNVSYPWIAPAGVRRGSVDNATSIGFIDADTSEYQSIAVGEGLRDVLYTARINPISVLPAAGITVYGQKTRSTQFSAMDRINVARLIAHLRYVLSILAKPFIFEPNDKLTRDEIKQEVDKYMNELIAKRAIYDYLVVCNKTNNTPSRIDRNELWVDVAIEPVKAVEFIYIPIRLKNTGEISTGA